jgi:hypothetical protein
MAICSNQIIKDIRDIIWRVSKVVVKEVVLNFKSVRVYTSVYIKKINVLTYLPI